MSEETKILETGAAVRLVNPDRARGRGTESEGVMPQDVGGLRHVPWTCQWGHFGETAATSGLREERQAQNERERSPWICLHPHVLPAGRSLCKGDCDQCPFWAVPDPGPAS